MGRRDLTPNWITVRVMLKTAPLEQWAVAREMRQRIKHRFDAEGIDFAAPERAVWRPATSLRTPPKDISDHRSRRRCRGSGRTSTGPVRPARRSA